MQRRQWQVLWALRAVALSLALGPLNPAYASKVALVITGTKYETIAELENPGRDGALIAKALTEAGFTTVLLREELKKSEFDLALRDFRKIADSSEIALVYFAGHGIELAGKNWLLPVDTQLDDPADIVAEGIPLDNVLHFVSDATKLRIVVLDACRDDPFALRLGTRGLKRGLSPIQGFERGTIVAYSAGIGQKAEDGPTNGNSPFAESLARRLVEPGLEIRFVFANVRDDVFSDNPEQEPWIGTSLSAEEIFLVPGTSFKASELAAFAAAAKRWTPDAWSDFLKKYPKGEFALSARQALASLSARDNNVRYSARSLAGDLTRARAAIDGLSPLELASAEPILLVAKVVAASSREALIELAASGDVRAQRLAARAYRTGLSGFPVDPVAAVALLKKGAAQGDPGSQAGLGFMYDQGEGGLPRDLLAAVGLYTSAAAAGDPIGQANLGAMYQFGLGELKQDLAEAVRLYSASAAQGSALGQANLGAMYEQGLGGLKADERQAEKLFRLAASQGNPTGQANLGVFIEEGRGGLATNPVEAVRLYRLAADQGNSVGQANLAYAYERGIGGLVQDRQEAIRLYGLAAGQQLDWARQQLDRLEAAIM